jgi:hypothetical protein
MRSFSHTRRPPLRFLPRLEALEGRCVPSTISGRHGTAVQNGTSLTISATTGTHNSVQVLDDGVGDLTVQWNGGASHFFSGINNITINTSSQSQTNNVTYSFTGVLKQGETINVNLKGTSRNNCAIGMEGMSSPSGGRIQAAFISVTDNGKGSDQIHVDDSGAVSGFSSIILNAQGGTGVDNMSAIQVGDITGGGNVGFKLRAASGSRKVEDTFFTSLRGNVGAYSDTFPSFFLSTVNGRFGKNSINDITSGYVSGTVAPTGNVQMSELGGALAQNNFEMLAPPLFGTGTQNYSVHGSAPSGVNQAVVTPNVVVTGVQSVQVV